MSLETQSKILRVLQDRKFMHLGGVQEIHVDVRVIAATNRSLREEVAAGRFREDLFYRLNVVSIVLPPLCERRQDIPALVDHFLTTRQLGKERYQVDAEAMRALVNYSWPGNIRELANVLERGQILAEDNHITLDDLPETVHTLSPAADLSNPDTLNLRELEHRTLKAALVQAAGNKVQAAKALGVSRRALYRLLTKHGLLQTRVDVESSKP
jgi:transcriptional regulator with PAS, ATPase and Fis domain